MTMIQGYTDGRCRARPSQGSTWGRPRGHPHSRLFPPQLTQEPSPPPLSSQARDALYSSLLTDLTNRYEAATVSPWTPEQYTVGAVICPPGAPSLEVTVQQCLGWEGFFDQFFPNVPDHKNHFG